MDGSPRDCGRLICHQPRLRPSSSLSMAHATSPKHSRESSGSSPNPLSSGGATRSSLSLGVNTFFSPIDPELDVRRDIALLSYLLSHTKVEGWRSSAEAKTLEALDPWTYLAFIINTGEAPYDKAGNKVIAVTGRIDREGITAAFVARNTSPDRLPANTPPLQIMSLKPQDPEEGESMLRQAIRSSQYVVLKCVAYTTTK